jgi:hypothetical protein
MIKPTAEQYLYPRASIAPGKVVWAKVEGHEWWPAKVVRRRAVPKEVRDPGAWAGWMTGWLVAARQVGDWRRKSYVLAIF